MIAYLSGKLTRLEPAMAIVECAGVGYGVRISLQTYGAVKGKDTCMLHTFMHVKEDAHTLYGFAEEKEKSMFMHLISVSGVGPGTALVMLSSLSTDEIRGAILTDNVRVIQGVKGIGAKTAQRLILELRDKVQKEPGSAEEFKNSVSAHNTAYNEALTGLLALGIAKSQAEQNLAKAVKAHGQDIGVENLIKFALKQNF